MKCPACENTLREMTAGDVKVDACDGGCGGLWFDNYELIKFDEPHEAEGESLLNLDRDPNVRVDHSGKRACPKCESTSMMRHFFSIKHEVEVDECPRCGGIWLDSGELSSLREQYKTEEERNKAADEYFTAICDRELEPMRKESREKLEKAQRIAHMFRFICPSYYIPGKQSWGAF